MAADTRAEQQDCSGSESDLEMGGLGRMEEELGFSGSEEGRVGEDVEEEDGTSDEELLAAIAK